MNADEARLTAEQKGQAEKKYLEIISQIKVAAAGGEFHIWYYKSLPEKTRKRLRELGYTVGDTMNDRNELLTEISW